MHWQKNNKQIVEDKKDPRKLGSFFLLKINKGILEKNKNNLLRSIIFVIKLAELK